MWLLHRFPLARLRWPPFAAWQCLASSKTLINPPLSSELISCWWRGGKLQSRELHPREGQTNKSSIERWGCWTSCLSWGSSALPGLGQGQPPAPVPVPVPVLIPAGAQSPRLGRECVISYLRRESFLQTGCRRSSWPCACAQSSGQRCYSCRRAGCTNAGWRRTLCGWCSPHGAGQWSLHPRGHETRRRVSGNINKVSDPWKNAF